MPRDLPAVRILPMSDKPAAFRDCSMADVQQWLFLRDLRRRPRYRYQKTGLNAPAGTIVLFQFKAHIIASAEFIEDEKFEKPVDGFGGVLRLVADSIRTFDPVNADGLRKAWPGFTKFGHVKQVLNAAGYLGFRRRLKNVRP